jgi:hypothetical protein
MSEDKSVSYEFQFKAVEYIVTMCFTNEDDDEGKLQLELEERETAERWKGAFDVACECVSLYGNLFWEIFN